MLEVLATIFGLFVIIPVLFMAFSAIHPLLGIAYAIWAGHKVIFGDFF